MKKTFIIFVIIFCFSSIWAQKASLTTEKHTAKDMASTSSKSTWVGGNCQSYTWRTDANINGGTEIFIKGNEYLTNGQQVQKVRFRHYYGTKNFTNNVSANFTCTSYTIEIYENPNLTNNYYSNVCYTPQYFGTTPVFSQTFDLSNAPNGIYEATLSTPYTYNGTPFLLGIKFDNGKGAYLLDSIYNTNITGGLFFSSHHISAFGNDANISTDANDFCLYDETSENGYYYTLGIELCIDSSNPNCDLEPDFTNTSYYAFGDNDTVIAANTNLEFYLAAFNNGPDCANGTFTFTCYADGGHNLLTSANISGQGEVIANSGTIFSNLLTLSASNMNNWGLVDFNITTVLSFSPADGSTATDPQANNTFVYNVKRTIAQPIPTTYTPLQNATNVDITTPISLTFNTDIIGNANELAGITITGSQSAGTISYNISGNTLQIFHSSPLAYGEQYTINIPANSFLYSNSASIPTPNYSWSFTTIDVPSCATLLSPINGTANIALNTELIWNPVANADSYDVYIGTTANPNIVANVSTTTYTTTLNAGTQYFWKIIAKNVAGDAINCDIWSFMTEEIISIPDCATVISPLQGTTNVPINTILSWNPVANADSYNIYFGTTTNPSLIANITTTTYTATLNAGTQYFWKVIAKNVAGDAINCDTWTFMTEEETDVNAINSEKLVNIYPNPSNGEINITVNEKSNIEIYDITGKQINSFSLNANESKTIYEQSGMYVIQIKTKDSTIIKKLIIK